MAHACMQQFEELFTKYDREGKGGLSLRDILALARANRCVADPLGW